MGKQYRFCARYVVNSFAGKLSKKQAKVVKTKVPKIPRPRLAIPRAAGSQVSTPSSMGTSSSDEESDYSSSDDELDIIETSPLPETRPNEALKATSYDTIKAVWLPRRTYPSSEKIRKGLKDVWEVLSTLRDRWKSDSEALKAATEKKKEKELPMLRERVKSQRDMLEVALAAALEHGHPEIIKLMGENKPFLQMCNIFLVDRARESDFDGVLPKQILDLLSRCSTVTMELLEQYKLKKTLAVFTKRGGEETKAFVRKIEDNATASSKAQTEKAKEVKQEKLSDIKVAKTEAPLNRLSTPDSVTGIKRPRPTDGSTTQQPAKRVASGSGTTVRGSPTLQKSSPSTTTKTMTPATVAAKPKAVVPTKTTGLFAGLQSASKKPGTSNAALAASKKTAAVGAEKKAPAPAAPMAAKPTSSFNFSDYMADLNKPKEPEPAKKEKDDNRPPETAEEKTKRLRKESRRHLRVSFKDGPALVEVRIFQHDPEEETGHDENMVRDVADVGLEGRMFKQHKEQMDVDDEEEEEEKLIEFHLPSLVDFSAMPQESRVGETANYSRFGGDKQPDSPEKEAQEKHESSTLMVYYSDSSEIPPCPREPADPYSGDTSTESKDFGEPDDNVRSRVKELHPQQAPPVGQPTATLDISALLATLSSQQQQPAPAPNLFAGFNMENMLPNQGQQAAPPPPAQAPPSNVPNTDLGAILASLTAHGKAAPAPVPAPAQQQSQQAPPPMPPFPMMTPGQAPDFNQLSQMAAMFAQAGAPPPPIPPFAPPMQQQGSSGGNPAGHYENPDRKRMRETVEEPEDKKYGGKKKWSGDVSFSTTLSRTHLTAEQRPKWVKACKFWKDGKCLKGSDCTFLHE